MKKMTLTLLAGTLISLNGCLSLPNLDGGNWGDDHWDEPEQVIL